MVRRILDEELQTIEEAVRRHEYGATAQQIAGSLQEPLPRRTLQYCLKYLVNHRRLAMEGEVVGRTIACRKCKRSSAHPPSLSSQPAPTPSKYWIDLSWNSSRLEGNTYSLLDTKCLIDSRGGCGRQRAA